jgi:hypothetical protein
MDALEECHRRLGTILGPSAERVEVLRCAEEHRAYWRPERVRVLLLAESHVRTSAAELERRVVLPSGFDVDVPRCFVRLVYCLGYGENNLLDRPILPNPGTPPFWKIFNTCLHPVESSAEFAPILKSRTPLPARLQNKLDVLERLKQSGVWLLDASVAAVYPKPVAHVVRAAIRASWESYVGPMVRAANPLHIICIGLGVRDALGSDLTSLDTPVTTIPQPGAHLPRAEHMRGLHRCYEIVQHYANY